VVGGGVLDGGIVGSVVVGGGVVDGGMVGSVVVGGGMLDGEIADGGAVGGDVVSAGGPSRSESARPSGWTNRCGSFPVARRSPDMSNSWALISTP
jgi:hypothetical protein